ncbi:MAG: DUF4292 domain-containing protein [Myxococcota bacterium]
MARVCLSCLGNAKVRRHTALTLGLMALGFTMGCPPAGPTIRHEDPTRAFRMFRSIRAPAIGVRAEARVEQWGQDGRIRGTVFMFVQRPESVRFDAMTQFGPAAILTSDGQRFALTDLRENRFLTGPTCPENIARLLGIPMSGADVALFLLGDTPQVPAEREEITVNGDGHYLITRTLATGGRQEIELEVRKQDLELPPDEQHLRLVRSELYNAGGDTEWRATYEDYEVYRDPRSEEGLGVAMPTKIRFEHPAQEADTTVRFEDIDLNTEAPPGAYRQDPPPGIRSEEVACQ